VRAGCLSACLIARRIQMIGERAPGGRHVRVEYQRAPQCRERGLTMPGGAKGESVLTLRRGGPRLSARERLQDRKRGRRVAEQSLCTALDEEREGMARSGLENLLRLLESQCGALLQQSPGVCQSDLEAADCCCCCVQPTVSSSRPVPISMPA